MAKFAPLVSKCTVDGGILHTPTLYRSRAKSSVDSWTGYAAAWDSAASVMVDITPYLPNTAHPFGAPTPSSIHGMSWSVHGVKTLTESAKKIATKGNNAGKKNAISAIGTALTEINKAYNKKVKEGYSSEPIGDLAPDFEKLCAAKRSRVFLEKVHDYKVYKHKLSFPLYIQRKYNGTTLCIVYHPCIDNPLHVDAYLRGRTDFHAAQPIAADALDRLKLANYPGLYLMGELYLHGQHLEDISGSARNMSEEDSALEYYIFDCFRIDKPEWNFMERYTFLRNMFLPTRSSAATGPCKLVEVYTATSDSNVMEYEKQFVAEGFEGAIVRNPIGLNMANIYKTVRSYDTMKVKPFFDDEFAIIGYTEGKGKDAGSIMFICKTSDGETFSVRPKGTAADRKALFQKMPEIWETQYKGAMAKIQYAYLSKKKVPQQPVMLGLRDTSTN